jgi:hypothetical protein
MRAGGMSKLEMRPFEEDETVIGRSGVASGRGLHRWVSIALWTLVWLLEMCDLLSKM